jgi:hypothetical protein
MWMVHFYNQRFLVVSGIGLSFGTCWSNSVAKCKPISALPVVPVFQKSRAE